MQNIGLTSIGVLLTEGRISFSTLSIACFIKTSIKANSTGLCLLASIDFLKHVMLFKLCSCC